MKILIIDDHILFAEGMKLLLESLEKDIHTLYADSYETALNIISVNGLPDLILLDINLAGVDGFTLIDKFHDSNIWSPILVVSATDSPSTAMVSLQKGASGFVAKSSNSTTLLNAIKMVLKGNTYIPQISEFSNAANNTAITARQREILCLLSQGMLNKQIAYELSISTNTVKAHLHQIFRELKANNRTTAVQNAQKCGLI